MPRRARGSIQRGGRLFRMDIERLAELLVGARAAGGAPGTPLVWADEDGTVRRADPGLEALVGSRLSALAGGDPLSLEVSLTPTPDGVGSMVVVRDVSARRAGERFADRILDHVAHPVFVKDREYRFVLLNRALCELVGYPREAMLGRTDYDFFPREQADFFRRKDEEMFASAARVVIEEEPITDATGALHVLATTKVPLVDEAGQVTHLVGIIHDITRLKEAEAARRRSDERLALALGAIRGGVWDWDLRTGAVWYSPEWCAALGYRCEEVEPHVSFRESLVHPDDAPARRALLDDHLAGRAPAYEAESRLRTASGAYLWMLHRGRVVERDGEGRPTRLVGVDLDISAQKEVQQSLIRARESAEVARAELEAFSYTVSHDLRAPLRALEGIGAMLLEDHGQQLDGAGRELIERLRGAARRMSQLIDDLLLLSRVTRAELRLGPADLTACARGILAELAAGAPGREVEAVVEDGLVADEVDAPLARLVLHNLLANAWKFTAPRPRARIEVGALRREQETVYFVRDDGVGFDMAFVDKLFAPFQRLHHEPEFPGTGIGLATVRRIVARHGGRVWAEATVGRGATFYFTLRPPPAPAEG